MIIHSYFSFVQAWKYIIHAYSAPFTTIHWPAHFNHNKYLYMLSELKHILIYLKWRSETLFTVYTVAILIWQHSSKHKKTQAGIPEFISDNEFFMIMYSISSSSSSIRIAAEMQQTSVRFYHFSKPVIFVKMSIVNI